MADNLTWKEYSDQINQLSQLDYNYDDQIYHGSEDKKGWYVDSYEAIVAVESPGKPLPNAAFEAVKDAINLYQFPDPDLIRAVFDPDRELIGRNMLMFAHFAGFTFTFGVRVTTAIDETRRLLSGAQEQAWGYAYRTLKGHFEIGEIRFEVRKNLATGEVSFHINAYSKPERIPNFVFRWGFRIFGRPLQKYFAKSSIERMQKLAQEALLKKQLQEHAENSGN